MALARRGLPRTPGGQPWPPTAGDSPGTADIEATRADAAYGHGEPQPSGEKKHHGTQETLSPQRPPLHLVNGLQSRSQIRRGLPRVSGGEAWPSPVIDAAEESVGAQPGTAERAAQAHPAQAAGQVPHTAASRADRRMLRSGPETTLRRGLPRVAGGDPWPPAGYAPAEEPALPLTETLETADMSPAAAVEPAGKEQRSLPAQPRPAAPAIESVPGRGNESSPAARLKQFGPYTAGQLAGIALAGGAALAAAVAILVLAVRWFLALDFMQGFLVRFPGEYHLPVGAPVGFPSWVGWQHFFNVFLMVMIIRSGLTVRHQKRPPAMWSPGSGKGPKISIALWFHQTLDILWLANGALFTVLLFATGQWMRIIPTSWEVFPDALSAALQYASLDWPTEDGWVNYNALQQLAYFATVFLAAPLAALTGLRMSGVWPKSAKKLSRAYPLEWARAVHFPVMVYFVIFIVVHVALVLATGALRNLNHMYGGSDDGSWVGFWIFIASLAVIAGGWFAARPLILASIARLFGKVSRS